MTRAVVSTARMCFGHMVCGACRHLQAVYWSPIAVQALDQFACVRCGALELVMTGPASIVDVAPQRLAVECLCRDLIADYQSPQRES